MLIRCLGFMGTLFLCLVGCFSTIILTPAVLSVLHTCVFYFCICTCSAQLSMFHMERRSKNTLIFITIIILFPELGAHFSVFRPETAGVLSPGVGRSDECAQGFAPQSHIHSELNQQDPISSDVFFAHSDQYTNGRW